MASARPRGSAGLRAVRQRAGRAYGGARGAGRRGSRGISGLGSRAGEIDAEGVRRIAPYLTGRDIRSAYFVPGDIYVEEPRSLLDAYMAAIAQLGSLVVGEAPVTGIRVDNGEITGVSTPRGDIATPLVIDAAGAWARGVGALAGVEVPVAPVRHQLLITQPIAGMSHEPIARIVDASAYLRPARGGLMMGGMESDPMAIDPRLDPGFSIPDTPLDMGVLDDSRRRSGRSYLHSAIRRWPSTGGVSSR